MELVDGYPLENVRSSDNAQMLLLLQMMNVFLMDQHVWLMVQHVLLNQLVVATRHKQHVITMEQMVFVIGMPQLIHANWRSAVMSKRVQMINANLFLSLEDHAQPMEPNVFHYQHAQAMLKLDVSMELMENAYLHYQLELLQELRPVDKSNVKILLVEHQMLTVWE